jgi:hypothetical protein
MPHRIDENGKPRQKKMKPRKTGSGVITKIENDHFVILSIKDEQGKISKYYWLTFIQSNTELSTKYKSLIGKKVNITYTSQDFFDPKLDEYRPIQPF